MSSFGGRYLSSGTVGSPSPPPSRSCTWAVRLCVLIDSAWRVPGHIVCVCVCVAPHSVALAVCEACVATLVTSHAKNLWLWLVHAGGTALGAMAPFLTSLVTALEAMAAVVIPSVQTDAVDPFHALLPPPPPCLHNDVVFGACRIGRSSPPSVPVCECACVRVCARCVQASALWSPLR